MQIVDRGTLGRRKQARVIVVDVKPVDGVVVPVQLAIEIFIFVAADGLEAADAFSEIVPAIGAGCIDIGAKREVVAKQRGRGHALQAVGIDQDIGIGGGAGPAGRAQEACVRRCHPEIGCMECRQQRTDLSPIAASQVEYPDIDCTAGCDVSRGRQHKPPCRAGDVASDADIVVRDQREGCRRGPVDIGADKDIAILFAGNVRGRIEQVRKAKLVFDIAFVKDRPGRRAVAIGDDVDVGRIQQQLAPLAAGGAQVGQAGIAQNAPA